MSSADRSTAAEARRLAALAAYEVLDTAPEREFDDIVRIAATICGTPMALISLVDDRRQWFKAALGVAEKETPREIAFCAEAIEQHERLFEVTDAAQDPRFQHNPLVTGDLHLRHYAGAPLRTAEGYAVGTLCVLDTQAGRLSAQQAQALEALARQVVTRLELRKELALRKASERDNRLAQRLLQQAQEAGGIGIFHVDLPEGDITGSPQFWRLFGLPPAESMSRQLLAGLVVEEDLARVAPRGLNDSRDAPLIMEYRIRRSDTGEIRWLYRRAEFELDESGTARRMHGVVRDVTDEHRARAMLEEREGQARESFGERSFVLDLIARQRKQEDPEGIFRLSAKALGERLGVSRVGFYRLTGTGSRRYMPGYSDGSLKPLIGEVSPNLFGARAEQARRSAQTLTFADSRHDSQGGLEAYAEQGILAAICLSVAEETGERWPGGLSVHHPFVRSWTAAEIALAREVAELTWLAAERAEAVILLEHRIGEQDNTIVVASDRLQKQTDARDVAEKQLRQLQKMEAVGQLTGGIAHDFNNMLAVVIGALNLIDRRLAKGNTDFKSFLDAAIEGANRAAALTQRLLAFSRQQPLTPEPLDPNKLIAGLGDLLIRTLGEQVQLETVLSAGVWRIKADVNQLENVVVNLATNARDAMPEGGKLTIETNNAHVEADYARDYEIPVGHYGLICVTDSGHGMPPEIIAKAFDPFFTTKGVGKGTGLGLSQVFGFMRQSGGHVKIYSEVGHGTTVKLYFPRYLGNEESYAKVRKRVSTPLGRPSEVIMVVEDEKRVQLLSVESLRELGYTVVHADGGKDALTKIAAGQAVSVLFTDVVMPEMTGRQLGDRIQQLLPKTKVVYTTGYTRNAIVHNGTLGPEVLFLPKPYTLDQLARIIRRALDD